MTAVKYPHIEIRAGSTAYIMGAEIKVIQIVLDRLAHHWDADEIQRQHPYLTLAQIYSALAYYHDHQAELDQDIQRDLRLEEELLSGLGNSTAQQKLQKLKAKKPKN